MITNDKPPVNPVTPQLPTPPLAPTSKAAPRTYEDCRTLIKRALDTPAEQIDALQQLDKFFEARITSVASRKKAEGTEAVQSHFERKWAPAVPPTPTA